jgi:hypothetical protein
MRTELGDGTQVRAIRRCPSIGGMANSYHVRSREVDVPVHRPLRLFLRVRVDGLGFQPLTPASVALRRPEFGRRMRQRFEESC